MLYFKDYDNPEGDDDFENYVDDFVTRARETTTSFPGLFSAEERMGGKSPGNEVGETTNKIHGFLQGALEFTDGLMFHEPWSYCDGKLHRAFKSEMEKGIKPAGKFCCCSVFLFLFLFFFFREREGGRASWSLR